MNMSTIDYVVSMLTRFKVKIVKKFYDKTEIDSKMSIVDSAINTVNNEAVHDNRDTLDKISEDTDGNFLFNSSKFVKQSSYDVFKLEVTNGISNLSDDILDIKNDISNIQPIADASTIMINITENGTVIQKTLQEVIDMILAGGYIPVTPTAATVAECGLAECGTAECGA